MISIGIEDIASFDFLDPPPTDAIEGALRQLILLDAILSSPCEHSKFNRSGHFKMFEVLENVS